MGATSVTGSGPGAAQNKGPGNGRDLLINPRVIKCGIVMLNSNREGSVHFDPPIPATLDNIAVFIQTQLGTTEEVVRIYNENFLTEINFVCTEPNAPVFWMIVSTG